MKRIAFIIGCCFMLLSCDNPSTTPSYSITESTTSSVENSSSTSSTESTSSIEDSSSTTQQSTSSSIESSPSEDSTSTSKYSGFCPWDGTDGWEPGCY